MGCRIVTLRGSPSTQEDPTIIKLLNRIITNTLEQSFVFLGLFSYFLIDGSANAFSPQLLLNLASWFIIGRWFFSAAYLFGTFIGFPQLRAYGVALAFFCVTFLIENIICK
eukprot:TRINITY_DN48728_c0_g1_i1.p1 TRINITY_DN48728_c0_g1~~TRINITY_DN48728_c0_g1_i1.p1  ORF type:complete len:111 (+),score=8.91 TRINITY_DN48728_c0_g1_i1:217-549(+)